ncbi:MAG: SDR family oxidoreductase [Anaerolineae bacterium]|nr:SDR family oxidoreductase [Anaerolineae bacterium]
MDFSNKVAFVTGANSGIGLAAAQLLAEKGAKVALLGRTQDEIEARTDELRKAGKEVMAVVADISKPDDMQSAYKQVMQNWNRLDIVCANAGINGVWAPIEELKPEDWDQTLDINLKGTFLTVKYAVPHLKKNGGSIIITSSVNGTRMFSNTGASAYATSKAGQVTFCKMVALELAPQKIRVNVICPGAITTEIDDNTEKKDLEHVKYPVEFPKGTVPLTHGSPGTAEQVAELIAFLASDLSSHISGTEVWIDGAQSLLQG